MFENLRVNMKMYMIEVSKSKISDHKPEKIIILRTLKHVTATSEYPVVLVLNQIIMETGKFG